MVKVGDRVLALEVGSSYDITAGKVYKVVALSNFNREHFQVRDDVGERNFGLSTSGKWKLVTDDELTELRAWKESALARFPALAQRETDDEAAERFRNEFFGTGDIQLARGFLKAFAWARNNPA